MELQVSSTSASHEKAFLGIDPNDTDEVKMGGATFTARVLPAGLWDMLTADEIRLMRDAARGAISRLAAQGKDPNELAFPDDKDSTVTILDMEANSDKEILLQRAAQQLEVIRFGLVKHEGFETRKGIVPFETEKVVMGGTEFEVVSKKTLAYYSVNKTLRESVYLCILRLNSLGELAKKV